MAKSSAVNIDFPFSLDSCTARRIFTLNTHEEKRLEKVRWNLEKQRMAETKKFLKAKKDIIIHHLVFRKVHFPGQVSVHDRLLTMNSGWKISQELLPSCSGYLDLQWFIPAKNDSKSKETCISQKGGTYCSNTATVSVSLLSHMRRKLASEENLMQRCRGWSSSARPNFRCPENKDSAKVVTKRSTSSARKNFIQENSEENKGKEKPLSEVLPPIRLPPLHSQKEKPLKEKRYTTLAMTEEVRKEKLWSGLEECRYLRSYKKK